MVLIPAHETCEVELPCIMHPWRVMLTRSIAWDEGHNHWSADKAGGTVLRHCARQGSMECLNLNALLTVLTGSQLAVTSINESLTSSQLAEAIQR